MAALLGLVIVGLVASSGAFAGPGGPKARAVDRSSAVSAALRALGVKRHTGAEIVFGLSAPVGAGTVVRSGGPGRPVSGGRPAGSAGTVLAKTNGSAWFFYEDLAPFQQYMHPGRVALVNVQTGRVTVSGTFSWPPTLNGQLPPFLSSIAAYDSHTYRLFYRPYKGAGALSARDLASAAQLAKRDVHAVLDPAAADPLGSLLASEHACTVRVTDTLHGGYYGYAWIAQSRAALDYRFTQLAAHAPGFRSFIYSQGTAAGLSVTGFVARQIAKHGCDDVLLYFAGGAYRSGNAVNIGMQLVGGVVVHQDVTAADLRKLIASHPKVHFELLIDAPHASGFQGLGSLPNVLEVATPVAPGGGSFTYLPAARVGGKLVVNDTNPLRLLQFTDRLAFGFDSVVNNPCEASQAESLARGGKIPSLLAYLIARGFSNGGPVDFVARSGVGSPPDVRTHGFSAAFSCPPPATSVVSARADSYTTSAGSVLSVDAAHGVLANDADSAGYPLSVDQLNGAGGTAPFTATTGKGATVSLNADGSFRYDATGSTSLRALQHGQTATDTFTYRASDGHGGSATATVTITVTGLNHPPVANPDSYAVDNNAVLNEAKPGLLANDTDADGDALTVDQLNGTGGPAPLHGTSADGAAVTLNADGSFTYDPTGSPTLQAIPRGQATTDTFTYRANDGNGRTATATVTITVAGVVNHPPVANPDSYAVDNNAVLNEAKPGVLGNDTDADGDSLTVDQLNGTGGTAPFTGTSANGAAVALNADGSFSYDPTGSAVLQAIPRGQTMLDTFTYRVSDGHGGTATATVTITVTGAVNHPPVANPDSYAADNNAVLSKDANAGVLGNDTDPDGDMLTVDQVNGNPASVGTTITTGKGAALKLNSDGSFTYDPTGSAVLQALVRGQTTTDTFTYRANDGHGGTATATSTITVTGAVNHPPVANPDSYTTNSNSVLTQPARGVLANDTDPDGDTLTVDQVNGNAASVGTSITTGKGATLTLNPDGSFTYDPTASPTLQALPRGQVTTDTFTYRANDGHGGTATTTVTITVVGVNHPPVANPDSYAANNNAVFTEAAPGVLGNDTDADGDSLTVDQLNGTGGTAPFTGTSANGAAVALNADGSFSYDPTGSAVLQAIPRGQTMLDTFTYRVSDGHGGTATATVTITVSGAVNHPPVANPDSYAANNDAVLSENAAAGVLANDTDPDGDTLTVDQLNGVGGTAPFTGTSIKGATVKLNSDGSFSYDTTGSATLQAIPRGQTTTDTFSYRSNDGHGGTATATVTITVTGAVNHPPVANPDFYSTNNGAALTQNAAGGVLANDTDGDGDVLAVNQLNGTGGTAPFTGTSSKGATVTLNADGSFSYDPAGSATLQAIPRGQTATDTFTYQASDGHGGTATATVTISVLGVINHPPVANPDSYAVDNNKTLTQAAPGVLGNDTDSDGDALTVDQLNGTGGTAPFTDTSAKGATVTLNPDGSFSYDPTGAPQLHPPNLAIGSSTPDTFTYEVNDGHGGTATGTVTITVTAVDTPPTANDFTVGTNVVGNTLIEVGTQPSPSSEPKTTDPTNMAAHSSDPDIQFGDSLTFTAPATSAHGGNVSVTNSSTGAFTYRPPPGYTGTDTFIYTATDSFGKSDTGQVTLNVANMVWYVQNNATGAHDGRSGSPFNTLSSAESAAASAAGDFIYVFKGDGTNNGQNAGITLKANQTLLSEKYALVVGGQTLTAGNPANRPVIGNSAGNGVTLAAGDTVKGFDITGTNAGNFAIAGGTGDASGTIADNVLHGASSAGGLTLSGTSGTWAVSDLTATGTGGAAFDANAAGTVNFTGTNMLTGTGAGAFKNAGATTYSGTIGTTSSTGGAANGIDVSGAAGSITFSGGTLSATTSNAILASGGSANVTYSGTETNTAGHSVNVSGRTAGTITISATLNDTGTGVAISGNSGGTSTLSGATKTINTGANTAVSLSNNTGHTINITGGGLNVDTTTGDGVSVSGGGTVTISGGNDTIDTNGTGTALHITGASTNNISSDATINSSVTNTGNSVNITGHTGGTITESGDVKDRGTGITVTSNTGATIALSGKIDASTGTNTAFTATGGGTIAATGAGNTLTTTTGTALNVANTTIAASGLTFQSISAGTTTSGPTNAIALNNTGSSGGLTVSGTGTAASGGTIQKTTGDAVSLSTTSDVSLNDMNIQSTGGSGVRGVTAVQNFTFTNGVINNSGTGGGNQASNIAFNDPTGSATDAKVTGSVTITGNTLTNALWHGVSILQFAGALSDVNISNNTLTSGTTTGAGGASFGSGIQLVPGGVAASASTVTKAELNNNTITNFPGGVLIAVQCGTSNGSGPTADCGTPGSATNDIEIKNNILNGGGTSPNGSGGFILPNQLMLLTVNGRGQGQFTVQNNGTVADPLSGSAGNDIDISAGGAVTAQATVTGNQIDAAGQTVSGTSGIAAGVGPFAVTSGTLSTSTLYATVQNNSIKNSAGSGIRLNVNAGSPTLDAIVTGNIVTAPISATYGMQIVEGNNAGFTGHANVQISSNTSTGGTGGGNTFPGIGLRKFGTATNEFSIVGLSPSPATNPQMESYVAGINSSTPGTFGTNGVAAVNGSSSNWTAIASVPQPPALP